MNQNLVAQGGAALRRLQEGTYSATGERLHYVYYDTAILAAATTTHRMFTVPVGTGGKTLDKTNMNLAGQIPNGQNFKIWALQGQYFSHALLTNANLQLVIDMFAYSTLEFIIQNKGAILVQKVQQLMGSPLNSVTVPTVAGDNLSVGSMGRFQGIFPLQYPITLAAMTPFEVKLTHHTAVGAGIADDEFCLSLIGRLDRAS